LYKIIDKGLDLENVTGVQFLETRYGDITCTFWHFVKYDTLPWQQWSHAC